MDRTLKPGLVRKPLEEITQEVEQIYESGITKGMGHLWRDKEELKGKHKIYMNIGAELVDYHIADTYDRMADLVQDFALLGNNVAHLVLKYNDRGLTDEEDMWLGGERIHYMDAGGVSFDPSENLAKKSSIQECQPHELVKLFKTYLERKGIRFAREFDYGPSIDKVVYDTR